MYLDSELPVGCSVRVRCIIVRSLGFCTVATSHEDACGRAPVAHSEGPYRGACHPHFRRPRRDRLRIPCALGSAEHDAAQRLAWRAASAASAAKRPCERCLGHATPPFPPWHASSAAADARRPYAACHAASGPPAHAARCRSSPAARGGVTGAEVAPRPEAVLVPPPRSPAAHSCQRLGVGMAKVL